MAVLGLVVNGISVFILGFKDHDHDHDQGHDHAHAHDHNLKSAYLHVIADALTSVLAIVALLAAKYFGLVWMDPVVGVIGAVLVARWSYGLLGATSAVLLDRQAPEPLRQQVRHAIEAHGDTRVTDLHVWSIGARDLFRADCRRGPRPAVASRLQGADPRLTGAGPRGGRSACVPR